jgi:hypothetical protein
MAKTPVLTGRKHFFHDSAGLSRRVVDGRCGEVGEVGASLAMGTRRSAISVRGGRDF